MCIFESITKAYFYLFHRYLLLQYTNYDFFIDADVFQPQRYKMHCLPWVVDVEVVVVDAVRAFEGVGDSAVFVVSLPVVVVDNVVLEVEIPPWTVVCAAEKKLNT